MSIPRLLKRLSRKNLRGDESPEPDVHSVPPLPPPKTAYIGNGYAYPITPPYSQTKQSPPATPNAPWAVPRPYMSDTELPLHHHSVPPVTKYSTRRPPPVIDSDGHRVSAKKDMKTKEILRDGAIIVAGVSEVVEAVGGIDAIEEGVNNFMEGSQVLMNALGEVAKLHPFSEQHYFPSPVSS
jgi:hypothetical protein